jgi:uncharacterized protein YaaQ
MRLIIAIVHDTDTEAISRSLTSTKLRVTHIASTGGFLRHGNSTLLIGLEDDQVEKALQIIRKEVTHPEEPEEKRAVVFVLKVDQYERF